MNVGIVDVSSVFYPAWHAGADRPVGFAYGITLERIRRFAAQGFDLVVVACDWGRTFRHDLSPKYKAHRAEPDVGLVEQLRRVQEAADADGHRVLRVDGFEADDIIATVATWFAFQNATVEILSSDKDLLALVGPSVRVRGVQSNAIMDEQGVRDKWGVSPGQMRDLLALMGDRADGIGGVDGVGKATAAKLLTDYGSISGIHAAMNAETITVPERIYKALAQAFITGSLDLDQRLVTLRTDVPIDFDALAAPKPPRPHRPDFLANLPDDEETMTDPMTSETPETPEQESMVLAQPQETQEATIEPAIQLPEFSRALEPRSMKQAMWLSSMLFESRAFSGYGSPEQIAATILAGRGLGLGAVPSLLGINFVRGRIAMSSALMVGLCVQRDAEFFDLVESTADKATYATRRRGKERTTTHSFTRQDANDLGLVERWRKGNQSIANMLRHRCAAELCRIVYPHIVTGVYLPDELSED